MNVKSAQLMKLQTSSFKRNSEGSASRETATTKEPEDSFTFYTGETVHAASAYAAGVCGIGGAIVGTAVGLGITALTSAALFSAVGAGAVTGCILGVGFMGVIAGMD